MPEHPWGLSPRGESEVHNQFVAGLHHCSVISSMFEQGGRLLRAWTRGRDICRTLHYRRVSVTILGFRPPHATGLEPQSFGVPWGQPKVPLPVRFRLLVREDGGRTRCTSPTDYCLGVPREGVPVGNSRNALWTRCAPLDAGGCLAPRSPGAGVHVPSAGAPPARREAAARDGAGQQTVRPSTRRALARAECQVSLPRSPRRPVCL